MSKQAFGQLLHNYQVQLTVEKLKAEKELVRRNKLSGKTVKFEHKSSSTQDSNMIHTVQVWQLVDEEHIKLSGAVTAEIIKPKQARDELSDILQ